MFGTPRYLQSSFSAVFPRQVNIRRRFNDFEDILQSKYSQPQIINVPDDVAPEIPRIIFISKFTQIAISQASITLTVNFSLDWQTNIEKGRAHLHKHMPHVFRLLDTMKDVKANFCGLTTQVHIQSDLNDDAIVRYLASLLLRETPMNPPHDIEIKTTTVVSDQFFNNITIANYRLLPLDIDNVIPVPDKNALERGIQVNGDFNDRYAFNERDGYKSSQDVAAELIDGGIHALESEVARINKVNT